MTDTPSEYEGTGARRPRGSADPKHWTAVYRGLSKDGLYDPNFDQEEEDAQ